MRPCLKQARDRECGRRRKYNDYGRSTALSSVLDGLNLDTAIRLRWALRDIKAGRRSKCFGFIVANVNWDGIGPICCSIIKKELPAVERLTQDTAGGLNGGYDDFMIGALLYSPIDRRNSKPGGRPPPSPSVIFQSRVTNCRP